MGPQGGDFRHFPCISAKATRLNEILMVGGLISPHRGAKVLDAVKPSRRIEMAKSDRIGPTAGAVQPGQPTPGELDLLRSALEASGDVAYAWDLDRDTMQWSSNAQHAFSLDAATTIATRTEFICRVNGEDLAMLARVRDGHQETGEPYQVEYRLRGDDGSFSWVQDRGVIQCNADGRPARAVGTIRVITEHKDNEAHLAWLTNFDEVTGHYNRLRLRELLDHAFAYAARYETPGAYLSVAIDDLPVITDAYGRDVADRAVIAVSLALDKCLRDADVVGRVAPDQFGIIISSCPDFHTLSNPP